MQIAWPPQVLVRQFAFLGVGPLSLRSPIFSGLFNGIQGVGIGTTPRCVGPLIQQQQALPRRAASSSPVGNQPFRRATRRLALRLGVLVTRRSLCGPQPPARSVPHADKASYSCPVGMGGAWLWVLFSFLPRPGARPSSYPFSPLTGVKTNQRRFPLGIRFSSERLGFSFFAVFPSSLVGSQARKPASDLFTTLMFAG